MAIAFARQFVINPGFGELRFLLSVVAGVRRDGWIPIFSFATQVIPFFVSLKDGREQGQRQLAAKRPRRNASKTQMMC